jgi:hypothetical protein
MKVRNFEPSLWTSSGVSATALAVVGGAEVVDAMLLANPKAAAMDDAK